MAEEEDDEQKADLLYEKVKKDLLADHILVTRFLMSFSVAISILQIVYATYWLLVLHSTSTQQEHLMISTMHYIRIFFSCYISYFYIEKIKCRQTATPIQNSITYLTFTLYTAFLFFNLNILSPSVEPLQVYVLVAYPVTDAF